VFTCIITLHIKLCEAPLLYKTGPGGAGPRPDDVHRGGARRAAGGGGPRGEKFCLNSRFSCMNIHIFKDGKYVYLVKEKGARAVQEAAAGGFFLRVEEGRTFILISCTVLPVPLPPSLSHRGPRCCPCPSRTRGGAGDRRKSKGRKALRPCCQVTRRARAAGLPTPTPPPPRRALCVCCNSPFKRAVRICMMRAGRMI
jgi:hypothetical protein